MPLQGWCLLQEAALQSAEAIAACRIGELENVLGVWEDNVAREDDYSHCENDGGKITPFALSNVCGILPRRTIERFEQEESGCIKRMNERESRSPPGHGVKKLNGLDVCSGAP